MNQYEKNEIQKKERLGTEKYNNQGSPMKVIRYDNAINVWVEFQDEFRYVAKCEWNQFKDGRVKNPYYPSVEGFGYLGGVYATQKNIEKSKEYRLWKHMLKRCFDKSLKEKQPTYKDVTCCDEWLNFSVFYNWLHDQPNFYKWINGESREWHLDKDILIKGNKTYCPKRCSLVPARVNCLFVKSDSVRGSLPIGVWFSIKHHKYMAYCNNPLIGKRKHIGLFDTSEEAFNAYKKFKEIVIKQVAEIEFNNGNITERCYEAMMNYQVEITD